MKVLVTGGCGFIGSNFIAYMLSKYPDYHVVNLDLLTYAGNAENTALFRDDPRYRFIKGDIRKKSDVLKAMKGCDMVVNFAAESHVDNAIDASFIFTQTNVFGTHILLEAARRLGVKRFLHISTDEVYGSIVDGEFTEESKIHPNNPYSASKAAADHLALSYFVTHKLPVVITRSSNNYGPYQHPEKVIPLFVTNLIEGKKVPLYGTGRNTREWIHVLDNCKAIDLVLHEGVLGEIYNISSKHGITNLELTHTILELMDKDHSHIQYVEDRKGHDLRYAISTEKIMALGWDPSFSFGEGIRQTVRWYHENDAWWRPLKSRIPYESRYRPATSVGPAPSSVPRA